MQQTLNLLTNPDKSFENFICNTNMPSKHKLEFFLQSNDFSSCVLLGKTGYGKTHLLSAACLSLSHLGESAYLLSLKHPHKVERLISGNLHAALICIDDIDLAFGNEELELLLFKLYNHVEQVGSKLIWACTNFEPHPFQRKDLNSRYRAMLSLQLSPYTLPETELILKHYILQSQIAISDEACRLLLREYSRNLSALISKLREIDAYASSHKKKITLKICRDLIGGDLHQLD